MGAVYAVARDVLVVLSPSAYDLLNKVRQGEVVGTEELLRLEEDDWIGRAWTYQEMVNSKAVTFVAEGKQILQSTARSYSMRLAMHCRSTARRIRLMLTSFVSSTRNWMLWRH
jgi:hypothetical protein